jgi:hypothetical protein
MCACVAFKLGERIATHTNGCGGRPPDVRGGPKTDCYRDQLDLVRLIGASKRKVTCRDRSRSKNAHSLNETDRRTSCNDFGPASTARLGAVDTQTAPDRRRRSSKTAGNGSAYRSTSRTKMRRILPAVQHGLAARRELLFAAVPLVVSSWPLNDIKSVPTDV